MASKIRYLLRSASRTQAKDWHTNKYTLFAAILMVLTIVVVVVYYLNHSQIELTSDTPSYLTVAHHIQTRGQLVDVRRLPGYPLLIVLVFALIGRDNMVAVSIAQAVLFVLATLELYVLAVLVLRRGWAAFFIGLLVGTNLILLSFVKPLISEALAIWLFISLALAVVLFVYTLRVCLLWWVTVFTLALFLTRAEWIYVPVPLFGYLLIVAARHGVARKLLPHILGAVVLLYAVLGNYIYINAMANNFAGVTDIQNMNTLGKVLQYRMQDEAASQYAAISRTLDAYLARGITDPWYIRDHELALAVNRDAFNGHYAQEIIEHHPVEFLTKSVPLAFSSLSELQYEMVAHSPHSQFVFISKVDPNGPFGTPLVVLQTVFRFVYKSNTLLPLCAAIWLFLLFWRRTAQCRVVQAMGGLVLLTLYGLMLTTLSGYTQYTRLHAPFSPLLIFVVWSSLLAGVLLAVYLALSILCRLFRYTSHYDSIHSSFLENIRAAIRSVLLFGW
jgi:hypothetical protein